MVCQKFAANEFAPRITGGYQHIVINSFGFKSFRKIVVFLNRVIGLEFAPERNNVFFVFVLIVNNAVAKGDVGVQHFSPVIQFFKHFRGDDVVRVDKGYIFSPCQIKCIVACGGLSLIFLIQDKNTGISGGILGQNIAA